MPKPSTQKLIRKIQQENSYSGTRVKLPKHLRNLRQAETGPAYAPTYIYDASSGATVTLTCTDFNGTTPIPCPTPSDYLNLVPGILANNCRTYGTLSVRTSPPFNTSLINFYGEMAICSSGRYYQALGYFPPSTPCINPDSSTTSTSSGCTSTASQLQKCINDTTTSTGYNGGFYPPSDCPQPPAPATPTSPTDIVTTVAVASSLAAVMMAVMLFLICKSRRSNRNPSQTNSGGHVTRNPLAAATREVEIGRPRLISTTATAIANSNTAALPPAGGELTPVTSAP